MPEPDPSAPSSETGATGHLSTVFSWIAIIASVIVLAWSASEDASATDAETDEISTGEATELAILKIQSRLIIGFSQVNPAEAARSLSSLESIAETDRGTAAVAILHSFVGREDGKQRAFSLLEEIGGEENELRSGVEKAIREGVTESERESLRDQVGWFSELVPPVADHGPSGFGATIRSESLRSTTLFGAFLACGGLGLLAGLILLILFITFVSNGTLKLGFQPDRHREYHHLFVEVFAIYLGTMAAGDLLGRYVDPGLAYVTYAVSFVAAMLWPKIRGCNWRQFRQAIGWHRGKGCWHEIGAGILGYLGVLVVAAIGLFLTAMLMGIVNLVRGKDPSSGGSSPSHPIVTMLDGSGGLGQALFLFFFAAGVAPFLEEILFRGTLQRHLRHRCGFWISAIVGGFVFAVIHPQGLLAVPALTSMGFGFALLREWRDSLIAPMVAHALNNGMIVTIILAITS